MDMDAAARADLLIWPGTCPIHQRYGYKSGLIEDIRSREPEAKIIVHPESPPRIVQMADEAGSTSVIINYCDEAPPGSIIYVGTEENLVARLAERHRREKTIRPLYPTYCSNMAKTTEKLVAEQLASLDIQPRIAVGEDIAAPARKALNTMLGVSA